MASKGWEIPELPVVYIDADNEEDAKEKVLLISSQYGEFLAEEADKWVKEASEGFDDVLRLMGGELKIKGVKGADEDPEYTFAEELMESHNYVVLYFDNDVDWQTAKEKFGLKTVCAEDSKPGYVRKGIGRVIRGDEVLKRLED
jgi:hypothetical protein